MQLIPYIAKDTTKTPTISYKPTLNLIACITTLATHLLLYQDISKNRKGFALPSQLRVLAPLIIPIQREKEIT